MKVLVVAAHPDDEVLGCGGTIARLADEDNDVSIMILGEGITSRPDADVSTVDALQECARRAGEILGAGTVMTHRLPDNRFDTVSLLDIVRLVEDALTQLRPDVVYTHYSRDLNVDHQLTARAVLTATRPIAGSSVRELYAFEIPSATEWAFSALGEPFSPDTFISMDIERKAKALSIYEAELRAFPHPRSYEAVAALAQYRGAAAGVSGAEAFMTVRRVV